MFSAGLMMAGVGAGGVPNVAELFATTLWSGTGAQRDIVTGVDLSAGGLAWLRRRTASSHLLFDDLRAATNYVFSNTTAAQGTSAQVLNAFNSDGFAIGTDTSVNGSSNYVGWSFKQANRFFQRRQFTHTNGVATNIDLSALGEIGMVAVKRIDSTSNWFIRHRSSTEGFNLLFTTAAESNSTAYVSWSGTTATFSASAPSGTYILYAWAHDTASDGIIQCGSYTGNGSATGPTINLGWQPQYLMFKRRTGGLGSWHLFDSARSTSNPRSHGLLSDSTSAEFVFSTVNFDANGFQLVDTSNSVNANGSSYVYLAIRAA